jgi:hypothetical protein
LQASQARAQLGLFVSGPTRQDFHPRCLGLRLTTGRAMQAQRQRVQGEHLYPQRRAGVREAHRHVVA